MSSRSGVSGSGSAVRTVKRRMALTGSDLKPPSVPSATRGGIPARRAQNPRTSYPTKTRQHLPPHARGQAAIPAGLSGRMVAARPAERGGPRIGDPVPVAIAPAGGGGDLGQFMLGHEARQYALRAAI